MAGGLAVSISLAAAGSVVPGEEAVLAGEADRGGVPPVYDDKGKRDPLWPLVSSSGAIHNYEMEFIISDLNLEGIMFSEQQQSAAIVNGRVVKVADRIGQYTVQDIRPEAVILINGNQRFELRLEKGE